MASWDLELLREIDTAEYYPTLTEEPNVAS